MSEFDKMDMELLQELSEDGAISIPTLAKKMNVNSSVLYSRIKRMKEKNLIKRFTVDIDESMLGIGIRATIGINRDSKSKETVHKSLLGISEVLSITEVTGRFDMLVNIHTTNLGELHTIAINKIGKITGVYNTETFVELQKKSKSRSYTSKKKKTF